MFKLLCITLYLEIYFNTVLQDYCIMSKTTQETREITKSEPTTSTNQRSANLHAVTSFFDEMEKSVSQYRQSMEDYQQECVRSYRKNFESIVSSQKKFSEKSGTIFAIPKASEKIISDMLDSFSKAYFTQRQTSVAMFRAATQGLKALNDNVKSFSELNQSIIQAWVPNWSTKKD